MTKACGLCYQCCNGYGDLCESAGVAPTCCGEVVQNTASGKVFHYCRGCKEEVPKLIKTLRRVLDALSIQDKQYNLRSLIANPPPAGPQGYPPPPPQKVGNAHVWNAITVICDDCGMTYLQHSNVKAVLGQKVADHCTGPTKGGHVVKRITSSQFECVTCGDMAYDFDYFHRTPCTVAGWTTALSSGHKWQRIGTGQDPDCIRCGVTASGPDTPVPPCSAPAPLSKTSGVGTPCSHPPVNRYRVHNINNSDFKDYCGLCGDDVSKPRKA